MEKKVVSAIMLTLLLAISMLTLAFNIQPVSSDWTWTETIYIRADGSVEPSTAPILSVVNVTYVLTDNIYGSIYPACIVVERDNIVVDGTGYTVESTGLGRGFHLSDITNVTIKNTRIKSFYQGIYLSHSSCNSIVGNNITNNGDGIGLDDSSNNSISGNDITDNGAGMDLDQYSSFNSISGNNITNNRYGISIHSYSNNNSIVGNNIAASNYTGIGLFGSNDNSIVGNNIAANNYYGIWLFGSNDNSIVGNNITNNGDGIGLDDSSDNAIYHNSFIENSRQVNSTYSVNTWDNGYPSGGNCWSDYTGEDVDGDGIGDTPYVINGDNEDRYPLMNLWRPLEHELVVSITAPASISLGSSSSLNATVTNQGLNDEANMDLSLLINGAIIDSTTIPLLQADNSYVLTYPWTPTVEGTYNVTAYAHPLLGETSVENNRMTKFVTVAVSAPPEVQVGVKAGDWIKCDYTVTGWPSGTPCPEWLKVEILSVEGTTATVVVTMHMSDGTEQSDTVSVDVVAGGGTFDTLFGFVIPADCSTGDSVVMGGDGLTFNVTIDDETIRTYAEASRTVVYASFSQYGTQLTYYWDKQTGIMVEASTTSAGITGIAKATETNMWQAQPSGFLIDPTVLYALIIVAIAIVVALAFFMIRRRKKLPKEIEPPKS